MSNGSICKFMPHNENDGNLRVVNFVFEAEFKTLAQPFFSTVHRMHLVTKGNATLKLEKEQFKLCEGCIFFVMPGVFYTIDADEQFEYMYISFTGKNVGVILEKFEISLKNSVYHNFEHLLDFWFDAIRRVNPMNANILPESVLLYTLSFFDKPGHHLATKNSENFFDTIIEYINVNFTSPNISLKQIAGIFSYTPKYLSFLFKKNMNVGFNDYINHMRMEYARSLFEKGVTSITQISELCGFSDPLYFSKVFKKKLGVSPSTYIKEKGE